MHRRLSLVLLLCAAGPVQADLRQELKDFQREQAREPVTLRADRAEWRAGERMVYEGGVTMESGALRLTGERIELRPLGGERYQADLVGKPARLTHAAQGASPELSAEAQSLAVDSRLGLAQLRGDVRLQRGEERLSGDSLRYDVNGRRIQAAGGENRVRIEVPAADLLPKAPQP